MGLLVQHSKEVHDHYTLLLDVLSIKGYDKGLPRDVEELKALTKNNEKRALELKKELNMK